jgi:hypothetical protein
MINSSSANDNDSIGAGHFQVKMECQVKWQVETRGLRIITVMFTALQYQWVPPESFLVKVTSV